MFTPFVLVARAIEVHTNFAMVFVEMETLTVTYILA